MPQGYDRSPDILPFARLGLFTRLGWMLPLGAARPIET
jgi:hypothetical protein